MRRVTLCCSLLLALLYVVAIVNCMPLLQAEKKHQVEKRSIFGLSAFLLSTLNAILAISLNTSINRQNAEFGGIVG